MQATGFVRVSKNAKSTVPKTEGVLDGACTSYLSYQLHLVLTLGKKHGFECALIHNLINIFYKLQSGKKINRCFFRKQQLEKHLLNLFLPPCRI